MKLLDAFDSYFEVKHIRVFLNVQFAVKKKRFSSYIFVYLKCSCEAKLNSLFDTDMKVYYCTHVLQQGDSFKMMCPSYKVEFIASLSIFDDSFYLGK